ncbi:MAG: hypothetical protein LBD43_01805, partial [Holosporales bacterium]|nr:hypothetical protein [Holosporales bacterium]
RGGEYHEHDREVERLSPVVMMDEVEIGDEDEVVERGCYVEKIQKVDTLQEMLRRYERLSREILRTVAMADAREETLRRIRTMVDWCGSMHLLREQVIERIYDTTWTINGEPVMGRTSGWRWYEMKGGAEATHMVGSHTTVVTNAYAASRDAPLQWASIIYTHETSQGGYTIRNPQRYPQTVWMYDRLHIPLLPEYRRAEMVVVAYYGDGNYSQSPSWMTADGGSVTGIAIYTYDSMPGTPYSGFNALLKLPVSTALGTVINDPGDGYTLGVPPGMRWRAIVGEYVAP